MSSEIMIGDGEAVDKSNVAASSVPMPVEIQRGRPTTVVDAHGGPKVAGSCRRRPPSFAPTFKRRIDYGYDGGVSMETSSGRQGGGRGKENVDLKRFNRHLATSVSNLSVTAVRNIKDGANKTLQSVKTTFDSLSQKIRRSTRRRHQLENWTTPSRRSPRFNTKLYSPFGIDTPGKLPTGTPGRYTPKRKVSNFVSPAGNFRKDVDAAQKGSRRLVDMAREIESRRSFRN